jgi:hypothetical protein
MLENQLLSIPYYEKKYQSQQVFLKQQEKEF